MMAGATHKASELITRMAPSIRSEPGVLAKLRASPCMRQPTVFEPFCKPLRPALDAHVLRSLSHVECVFALRVDVRLDGGAGIVILAREVEQDRRHIFVIGRA